MNSAEFPTTSYKSKNELEKDFSLIHQGQLLNDWFVFREERHFGPLSAEQVNKLLLQKKISIHHHIWRPGFENWVAISEVESFRACGVSEIEIIDDNRFSDICELKNIDLIAPDIKEINFIGSRLERITNKRKEWTVKAQDLLQALGVSEQSKIELGKYAALALLICITSISVWTFWPTKENIMQGLSKGVREHLVHISKQPEHNLNIQFAAFDKSLAQPDPVFVMATNLPVGSLLRVSLVGDSQTLLGTLNFSKEFETKIDEKIFQTSPIRGRNGQYIPAGTYSLKVVCLSCGTEAKNIFEQKYNLGIQNLEEYKYDLASFHQKIREMAKSELTELESLANVLAEQYKKTLNGFVGMTTKSRQWDLFSADWLKNQNQVIDVFAQMNAEGIKEQIYYLPLYLSYKDLAKNIFELHVMQDTLVKSPKNSGNISKEISKMSHKISLNITHLKSQVDLMSTQAFVTEGLPPKKGLNSEPLL